MVWVVTFVAGMPMSQLNHFGDQLLVGLGAVVASIAESLGGYDHAAPHRHFHWDLANGLAVVETRLDLIQAPSKRQQIELLFGRFRKQTFSLLQTMPQGAIHHDANDGNVIVRAAGDSAAPNHVDSALKEGEKDIRVWPSHTKETVGNVRSRERKKTADRNRPF